MLNKLLSSQLRINIVSGVGTMAANALIMAVAYPLYLHFLGYEKYGLWLILATVLTFARLGNLGIDRAVMKLVAEEHGRGDVVAVQEYVGSAVVLLGASGVAVLALIMALRVPIVSAFKLSPENASQVLWLLPYAGCLSVYVLIVQALNATLSGMGRMDLANYAVTGGRLVAVLVAAILLGAGMGIKALLIGNVASYVFIHTASLVFVQRMVPVRLLRSGNFRLSRMKRLLNFGSAIFGGTIVAMLFHPINKILLARHVGVTVIPAYEIGYNGAMQVRSLMEVGLRAILPEISRMSAQMTEVANRRIIRINRHARRLILFVGAPLYAIAFILAEPFLRVWLGDGFPLELPGFLRLMLIGSLMSLLAVPAHYTLMGLGHVRLIFAGYAVPVLVHFLALGLAALVTRSFSLLYIGYTTTIGITVGGLCLLIALHAYGPRVPKAIDETMAEVPAPEIETAGMCAKHATG